MGGLGWPALAVLVATGLYLLDARGIAPGRPGHRRCLRRPTAALAVKLPLVLIMIGYQAVWGHRPAPIAIYFNMLAALIVLAASVVLVRGWGG